MNVLKMNGEIDQAAQYCEDRKVTELATLVPKIVDPNAVVFVFLYFLQVGSQWSSN